MDLDRLTISLIQEAYIWVLCTMFDFRFTTTYHDIHDCLKRAIPLDGFCCICCFCAYICKYINWRNVKIANVFKNDIHDRLKRAISLDWFFCICCFVHIYICIYINCRYMKMTNIFKNYAKIFTLHLNIMYSNGVVSKTCDTYTRHISWQISPTIGQSVSSSENWPKYVHVLPPFLSNVYNDSQINEKG